MTSAPATQAPPGKAADSPNETMISASLYVGDLHPEATETDLIEAFRVVGPIASVRLCRDRTRLAYKSLCYAYVNFFSLSDASKALACLNHTELRGKPMRIMWCQRDPLTRKTGIGNLYVKNLDPSITTARLEKIFSKYGTILSCKVAEKNGISKGFGFVQFDSEDSAMTAVDALHGTLLEGKNLYVSKFIKQSERKGTCGEETFTNLYVKNLDDDLTEDLLKEKFSEHGKVFSAVIMKNCEGKSRGFGFVQFETHQEAKKAMEALNGAQIGSKTLFVGRAQKKAEREAVLKRAHSLTFNRQKNLNLYVKNLDISIDDRKLREIFSAYGKITSAKVMSDDKGVSKGFGFVSFTSAEEAKKALDSLNGTTVQGLSLYVALAQHREEQSRQFQNYHARYPTESFYTSNWDIFTPRYPTPHYNFLSCPPLTLPYLSSQQPLIHPNLGRHVTAFHPFGVQKFWGNHSASVPLKQSESGATKHFVFQRNPMKSDSKSCVSAHDHKSQTKDKKSSRKWEVKNIHGAADASSRGSAFEKPFIATSTGMCKKSTGETFRPLVENIKLEHEAKITGMLLEMSKSNAQKLLSSPHSLSLQVEKAVQLLQEANSQSGSYGGVTLPPKSACSLHM